ncbi:hypothetical protein Tco_0713692 [Tanacetum coccineum]
MLGVLVVDIAVMPSDSRYSGVELWSDEVYIHSEVKLSSFENRSALLLFLEWTSQVKKTKLTVARAFFTGTPGKYVELMESTTSFQDDYILGVDDSIEIIVASECLVRRCSDSVEGNRAGLTSKITGLSGLVLTAGAIGEWLIICKCLVLHKENGLIVLHTKARFLGEHRLYL